MRTKEEILEIFEARVRKEVPTDIPMVFETYVKMVLKIMMEVLVGALIDELMSIETKLELPGDFDWAALADLRKREND